MQKDIDHHAKSGFFDAVRLGWAALVIALALGLPTNAAAAEKPATGALPRTTMFANVTLTGTPGAYLVKSNRVNVRAKPSTRGKRLSRLSKSDRVEVLGKVKGTAWLAVQKNGLDLGYVYSSSLVPYLDAVHTATIEGRALGKGATHCGYRIRFYEHRKVAKSVMETADYWVDLECQHKGKKFEAAGFVFMTLASYDLSSKPVFQVNFEIVEIGGAYEEVLSVMTLYDHPSRTLTLKTVTPKSYATVNPIRSLNTPTSASILEGVIRIAFSAWTERVWQELQP